MGEQTEVTQGLELRSEVRSDGTLRLSLVRVPVADPAADEVVVRVEAAPINPSDLGLLLGTADLATIRGESDGEGPVVVATVPESRMKPMAARLDQSMPVGNEGAGTVVRAGADAQHLLGRKVALFGGAMFAQYRLARASDCLLLPDGATAAQGASAFVNPLTALSMVDVLRREGYSALVHTAAASNLGQMLNRICLKDGIDLVNIVRSPSQAALLRDAGAVHVCDSSADDFIETLTEALAVTGATLAFDAIGGGKLAGQILAAMEAAVNRNATGYDRYGSTVRKQVYIYGALDMRPTEITRNFGFVWGVNGWLLTPYLMGIGREAAQALRDRVAAELTTTFASHYTATISLAEALTPAMIAAYGKRATGEKYLIDPSRG